MTSYPEMVPSDYHCPFCTGMAMVVNRRVRVIHLEECFLRKYLVKRGLLPRRYQQIQKRRLEGLQNVA